MPKRKQQIIKTTPKRRKRRVPVPVHKMELKTVDERAAHFCKFGVVVLPILNKSKDEIRVWRQRVLEMRSEAPEFLGSENGKAPLVQQIGAKGADTHPSSFHHPTRYELTKLVHDRSTAFFEAVRLHLAKATATKERKTEILSNLREVLFDPLQIRHNIQFATAGLHRDITPGEIQDFGLGCFVAGGWLNLNDYEHRLRCVPGGHLDATADKAMGGVLGKNGFTVVDNPPWILNSKSEEYKALQARMEDVRIPPGHRLIFVNRVPHMIRGVNTTKTAPMIRHFMASRMTNSVGTNRLDHQTKMFIGLTQKRRKKFLAQYDLSDFECANLMKLAPTSKSLQPCATTNTTPSPILNLVCGQNGVPMQPTGNQRHSHSSFHRGMHKAKLLEFSGLFRKACTSPETGFIPLIFPSLAKMKLPIFVVKPSMKALFQPHRF